MRTLFVLALAVLRIPAVMAGLTPAQNCQSAKNVEAAKYESCRQKAEANLAKTGDTAIYTATLQKCSDRFVAKWPALEAKAVLRGGVCPSVGDQTAIQGVIDAHTVSVAGALAGGTIQDCPSNLATCTSDLTTCGATLSSTQMSVVACNTDLANTQNTLATCNSSLVICQNELSACEAVSPGKLQRTGQTQCWEPTGIYPPIPTVSCAGTGQDGELQAGLERAYVDNGDGTITDAGTGLMWEKLSDSGGIHYKGATYTWAEAFSLKLTALNAGGGFAGYTDWRVPNQFELLSIVNLGTFYPAVSSPFNSGCNQPSCMNELVCSCTMSASYWSSSTSQENPKNAWAVNFYDGDTGPPDKRTYLHVRAVRGGL